MVKFLIGIIFLFSGILLQPSSANAACTLQVALTGAIGPANSDLFSRALKRVNDFNCQSMLVMINTPGGSLQTTRLIVEQILSSPVPVLCLVGPAGAHAGSAGAIILQACHVSGALRTTNLGAATPIMQTGETISEDLRKKIVNDTVSWLESLTKLRGRNQQFSQDIVTQAKAVSAEEALHLGAIDHVSDDIAGFLQLAKGRKVKMDGGREQVVVVEPLHEFAQDWRYQLLSLMTDPELAYLLLMGSIALIYFEITHAGVLVPGILGGMGLIFSLVAMHKLNVEWGGLLLIFLGIGLLIAEIFVAGFGVLGAGGLISFVFGSLFLFDPVETGGYQLPWRVILPAVLLMGIISAILVRMVWRTRRVRKRGGFDDMHGAVGEVIQVEEQDRKRGQISLQGEIWNFTSRQDLAVGQKVTVTSYSGLNLNVTPLKEE